MILKKLLFFYLKKDAIKAFYKYNFLKIYNKKIY